MKCLRQKGACQAGGEGGKARADATLLTGAHRDLFHTEPWFWLLSAPFKFWAARGCLYNPCETPRLSVCSCCPAGEVRKREEPCWGTLSTTTNAAVTSLFCGVEGREDPWDRAHPSPTPVLGFGRRGERNGLALTPVLRGARRLHLVASPLDNYKQAWALSNWGPTSPFLLGNNK